MRRILVLLLAGLALGTPAAAGEKQGFAWHQEMGVCDGRTVTRVLPSPFATPFRWQAYRLFMGAMPIAWVGVTDFNVQMYHSRGAWIDSISQDRYADPAGSDAVSPLRAFVTPWVFRPGDALILHVYCANGPQAAWHVALIAEGETE